MEEWEGRGVRVGSRCEATGKTVVKNGNLWGDLWDRAFFWESMEQTLADTLSRGTPTHP